MPAEKTRARFFQPTHAASRNQFFPRRLWGELASHGGGPVDMNMLCAIPNAIYMESGGKQKLVHGEVLAPETPAHEQ